MIYGPSLSIPGLKLIRQLPEPSSLLGIVISFISNRMVPYRRLSRSPPDRFSIEIAKITVISSKTHLRGRTGSCSPKSFSENQVEHVKKGYPAIVQPLLCSRVW